MNALAVGSDTRGNHYLYGLADVIRLFKNAKQYDTQLGDTTSILEADNDILQDYIQRFQLELWPDPDLMINATPSPAATDLEFACED